MPTRKLGFSALMTAVYKRLATDNIVTKKYTFYNFVPRTASFPYHVIQNPRGARSLSYTSRDTEAEDNTIEVHSWISEASGQGDKVCADRMNNIAQAITSSPLSVSGYFDPMRGDLEYSEILRDTTEPSLDVRHGIQRFRFEMAPSS
jgi:hypothetical protein